MVFPNVEFGKEYRTIAVSLRGYGDSDKPTDLSAYSITILIDDCYELIQHITKDMEKIILIGHDWGGLISWYFSMLYPELIEKLIIINASHPAIFIKHIRNDWQQFWQSWFIFFFQLPWLPELMFRSEDMEILTKMFYPYVRLAEEIDVYKYYFQTFNDCRCPFNYYRAFIRGYGHREFLKRLYQSKRTFDHDKIESTTLIIWSGQNINTTEMGIVPSLAKQSATLCRESTLKFIDNGSHWIIFEKPDEINQIIREFLNNIIDADDDDYEIDDRRKSCKIS
ncbi:soluble epoxide hydrolase-like protein [Euroglyphus maynei]|uniref:Soluble epoxide hydrolase-like protein n=1 Tax=Euroglyphus maynei TaxID=6958 RepID=A0A1Y3BRZ6_EURMA|nr:soluble epoxide hydrolase-like protein [Euroglyphus maynei]